MTQYLQYEVFVKYEHLNKLIGNQGFKVLSFQRKHAVQIDAFQDERDGEGLVPVEITAKSPYHTMNSLDHCILDIYHHLHQIHEISNVYPIRPPLTRWVNTPGLGYYSRQQTHEETHPPQPLADVGDIPTINSHYVPRQGTFQQHSDATTTALRVMEHDDVVTLSDTDSNQMRCKDRHVSIGYRVRDNLHTPSSFPKINVHFEDFLNIRDPVYGLLKANLVVPTTIQSQLITAVSQCENVIAVAPPAFGKTLGLLICAYVHIQHHQILQQDVFRVRSPSVVLLTPNVYTATEITKMMHTYGMDNCLSIVITENTTDAQLEKELNAEVDMVIATPLAFKRQLNASLLRLLRVTLIMYDDTDIMLQLCPEQELHVISDKLGKTVQSVFTSSHYSNDIIAFTVATSSTTLCITSNEQNDGQIIWSRMKLQYRLFATTTPQKKNANATRNATYQCPVKQLLDYLPTKSLINSTNIFSLELVLQYCGIQGQCIQSDTPYSHSRTYVRRFNNGFLKLLVVDYITLCTMDIQIPITNVIVYDTPHTVTDYIHILNKTTADSVTLFLNNNNGLMAYNIYHLLRNHNVDIADDLYQLAQSFLSQQ